MRPEGRRADEEEPDAAMDMLPGRKRGGRSTARSRGGEADTVLGFHEACALS